MACPFSHDPMAALVGKKLFIKTFGCQMNEYDSSRMADALRTTHGMELTSDAEQADVLLLNTCSVREKAQEKVFSQLGRWREWKQDRPELVIGVGGCVASQEGEDILKRAPYVDLVFGPQTLHRLPKMLSQLDVKRCAQVDVSFPEIEKFDSLPPPRVEGVRAYVSIMEGCSKYCSFCVVPYTRGEEFSRSFDEIITEVAELAIQGVREVTLLGQNVNGYRGLMDDHSESDFALLLRYIEEIKGIDRIRYTTSHPLEFTDELIAVHGDLEKLVRHLHLPVQSGSNRILKLMKRGYTAGEYLNLVARLRHARPDISLSSDFIVGYPGETEDDFNATLALIDQIGFDQSFSFIYSARPGTPASDQADDVPAEVKKQRLAQLQARINEMATEISRLMVGTTQQVLIDRPARKNPKQLAGRTEDNRVVNFDGPAQLIGRFANVVITEALPNSLRGRLIDWEKQATNSVTEQSLHTTMV